MKKIIFIFLALMSFVFVSKAQINLGQDKIEYGNPKKYELGGITVTGTKYLDQQALILLSGLTVGGKITVPGDATADAIKNLWDEDLFSDVQISYTRIQGNTIFLNIHVEELPRMSRFKFNGVTKTEADNLREDLNLYREKIVNENLIRNSENTVRTYYIDKGFHNVEVDIEEKADSTFPNKVLIVINVKKNKKVKISEIIIQGNDAFSDNKIKRQLKETKTKSRIRPLANIDSLATEVTKSLVFPKKNENDALQIISDYFGKNLRIRIFKSSKYLEENLAKDKKTLIAKYNSEGYRDAKVLSDSIYDVDEKNINLVMNVKEGNIYYFRNINFIGNTKHSNKVLADILSIEKGDIYNQSLLETRLYLNPNGKDISSLYQDNGYLFFNLEPVEVLVENDSIDIEIRIYEGQQARINKVYVRGNSKTNDHVIMREIRTKPGQLFSRADIIRTQRELAQLGFFDAEKLDVTPKPNPADATVDLEYVVEERPSDQIELSGGWGAGRVVGTLGVSFTNFSTRNFFKKGAWRPLPSGDGQKLSIRAQSNGLFFQSYNISFTEPWLGGKKPNALSLTAYHSVQSNGQSKFIKENKKFVTDSLGNKIDNPLRSDIKITGASIGLGKRLTWPDDYFQLYQEINYQHYNMNQWNQFIFPDGQANNLYYRISLSRNSIDAPIYPRLGSQITLSLQATAPYSAFRQGVDYGELSDQDKYRWIEYHKWKFTSSWFTKLAGNLVLNTRIGFGILGNYNEQIGASPFERFYLGGSGLTGFALDGREIIALRGYDDQSVSPRTGGLLINKYTMELRYPFSLNPSATIYGLVFAEGGNTWNKFNEFNPYQVKRSAGAGIRLFLPMFGLLGLDWGYRFDDVSRFPGMQKSQIHFTIGANLGEL